MDEFIEFLIANKDDIQLEFSPESGDLVSRFGLPNLSETEKVCSYGSEIKICNRAVQSVFWRQSGIALWRTESRKDAISFEFSGCVMAAFRDNMKWYVAHIQMGSPATYNIDCKRAWIQFVHSHGLKKLIMFKPDCDNRSQDHLLLWGVITKEGNCYSVFIEDVGDQEGAKYILRYIRQHDVSSYSRFYDRILRPEWSGLDTDSLQFQQMTTEWNSFWDECKDDFVFPSPLSV